MTGRDFKTLAALAVCVSSVILVIFFAIKIISNNNHLNTSIEQLREQLQTQSKSQIQENQGFDNPDQNDRQEGDTSIQSLPQIAQSSDKENQIVTPPTTNNPPDQQPSVPANTTNDVSIDAEKNKTLFIATYRDALDRFKTLDIQYGAEISKTNKMLSAMSGHGGGAVGDVIKALTSYVSEYRAHMIGIQSANKNYIAQLEVDIRSNELKDVDEFQDILTGLNALNNLFSIANTATTNLERDRNSVDEKYARFCELMAQYYQTQCAIVN